MKSKNLFRLMINPFSRITGWESFAIGLVIVVLSAIIGRYSYVCFDGVWDIHMSKHLTLGSALAMQLISTFTLVLVMCVTGLIVSKGFRFIDVLGTMVFARIPLLLPALAGFYVHITPEEIMKKPLLFIVSPSLIIFGLLSLLVVAWEITLMVNGFKVSFNMKGNKLIVSFVVAFFVSEIISKVLVYFIQ